MSGFPVAAAAIAALFGSAGLVVLRLGPLRDRSDPDRKSVGESRGRGAAVVAAPLREQVQHQRGPRIDLGAALRSTSQCAALPVSGRARRYCHVLEE